MASGLVISNLAGAVVGPVSLTVAPGTCTGIAGPSGAGKSLLLRMIADLDPSEGQVSLDGTDRENVSAPEWRRRVTYVAAEPGWWCATVAGHFAPATRPGAAEIAGRLGLPSDVFERTIATLSTGERQRLALVRALAHGPKALLLDEPTSALDTTNTERVEDLLRTACSAGTILLLVSHDPAQPDRLSDANYRMCAGRLEPA